MKTNILHHLFVKTHHRLFTTKATMTETINEEDEVVEKFSSCLEDNLDLLDGEFEESEREEVPSLEDKLIVHNGDLDGFKVEDDKESEEEMCGDVEPLDNDIEGSDEYSIVWRFPPIMVPPRETNILLESCLIMKYLCQETDNECFPHKIREDAILGPHLPPPKDFSSYTISSEIVEDTGVDTPYYLFSSQVVGVQKRRQLLGKNWSSQQLHRLLYQSLRVILGIQLQSLKKLMAIKEVLSWVP
ncbi:hypothetical protein LINGRAHAP2_LOCUS4540 [Linum grandiflorum]